MCSDVKKEGRTFLVPLDKTPKAWLLQAIAGARQGHKMSKPLSEIIAERVERALHDAGYRSQDEFANVADIPRATLHRVLSGQFDNRISTLEKIAHKLGVAVSDLVTEDPRGTRKGKSELHAIGPKKKSAIMVKILVPKDEEIPRWLIDACREGAGQIEKEPAKRKPNVKKSASRRAVGLGEILAKKSN